MRAPDLRSPEVFRPVVAATVVVAVVTAVRAPPDWLSLALAGVVLAVLGIPHGAVDHLVIEAIDGRSPGSRLRFVARYLLAMGVVGLVWWMVPGIALAGFLLLSVHHFGQSDLAYLRLAGNRQLGLQWSRGLVVVGLPLVAHLDTVAPIVERLGGGDPASWTWLAEHSWWWCSLLVGQHLVVGATAARLVSDRSVVRREAIALVALTLVLVLADPLMGFAVYFGLWHSLGHLLVLADLLGAAPSPARSIIRLAAPLTVVSIVALLFVAGGAAVAAEVDLVLPLVVVLVAMLTAPHMVVVERLWRRC